MNTTTQTDSTAGFSVDTCDWPWNGYEFEKVRGAAVDAVIAAVSALPADQYEALIADMTSDDPNWLIASECEARGYEFMEAAGFRRQRLGCNMALKFDITATQTNSITLHLTVYVGLLEENDYFSTSEDPDDLAVRWCEALRQIAARDGVELTLRPGVGHGHVAFGSADDSGWWDKAADEALSQANNLTGINTGAIGHIK